MSTIVHRTLEVIGAFSVIVGLCFAAIILVMGINARRISRAFADEMQEGPGDPRG